MEVLCVCLCVRMRTCVFMYVCARTVCVYVSVCVRAHVHACGPTCVRLQGMWEKLRRIVTMHDGGNKSDVGTPWSLLPPTITITHT